MLTSRPGVEAAVATSTTADRGVSEARTSCIHEHCEKNESTNFSMPEEDARMDCKLQVGDAPGVHQQSADNGIGEPSERRVVIYLYSVVKAEQGLPCADDFASCAKICIPGRKQRVQRTQKGPARQYAR